MWSVSHHTALQTQEGKHKKAQQEDDTLQRSIDVGDRFEDEPREFKLQIRIYNFERHSPIKCDQSPPPTLHSHRKKANPRKPNRTTTPWGARSTPTNDRRRTQELSNLDLSPNQMRSVSGAYEPHVERAGEPKRTHQQGRHLAALARPTQASGRRRLSPRDWYLRTLITSPNQMNDGVINLPKHLSAPCNSAAVRWQANSA